MLHPLSTSICLATQRKCAKDRSIYQFDWIDASVNIAYMKRINNQKMIKIAFTESYWLRVHRSISLLLIVLQFAVQALKQFVHFRDLSVAFLPNLLQSFHVRRINSLYLLDALHGLNPAQRARLRRNKDLVVAALGCDWNLRAAVELGLEFGDSALDAVSAQLLKLLFAPYLFRSDGLLRKNWIGSLGLYSIFEFINPRIQVCGGRF